MYIQNIHQYLHTMLCFHITTNNRYDFTTFVGVSVVDML